MSVCRWVDLSLTELGKKVHDFALHNGRCVVSMHGRLMYLTTAIDARHGGDMVAEIMPRHSYDHIHIMLLSGMQAAITEDTRG